MLSAIMGELAMETKCVYLATLVQEREWQKHSFVTPFHSQKQWLHRHQNLFIPCSLQWILLEQNQLSLVFFFFIPLTHNINKPVYV